jgi:hypothetical protein
MPVRPAPRQTDEISREKQIQYVPREEAAYERREQERESELATVRLRESQSSRDYAESPLFFEDEMSPFTGNLPAFNNEEGRVGQTNSYNEQSSLRSPVASKTAARHLWEYATGEAPLRGKIEK